MLSNYAKLAFRNLAKNKLYNGINIIGLGIGFCCSILIILYIWNELNYDTYHKNYQRIYRLESHFNVSGQDDKFAMTPIPLAPTMKDEFDEIEDFVRFIYAGNVHLKYDELEFFESGIYYSDANVLEVFSLRMILGDVKTALDEPNTIVLTQSLGKRFFGNENPIGKVIRANSTRDYRVTGIIEDLPQNVHLTYQALISMNTLKTVIGEEQFYSRDAIMFWNVNPFSYVLLKENANMQTVLNNFSSFYEKYMKSIGDQLNASANLMATPLHKIHLYSKLQAELPTGNIGYVYIFGLIALFILIIACINYMNIATARSAKRAREVGLRKAFGANQSNLVTQFLSESIVISVLSLLLAIAASEMLLPTFNQLSGKEIAISSSDLLYLYGFFFLISLFVGFLAGIYPAYYLSSFIPEKVLKQASGSSNNSGLLRKILVLIQFAISLIMISGTIVVYLQLNFFQKRDIGFNKENVVAVTLRDSTALAKKDMLIERIKEHNHVENVAASSFIPGSGLGKIVMRIEKEEEMKEHAINFLFVDSGFFDLMEMKILEGRQFNSEMETDYTQAFIVNQAAVQKFGWSEQALGKRIQFGIDLEGNATRDGKVVGIVQDFYFQSLHTTLEPYVIMLEKSQLPFLSIRLKNSELQSSLDFIQQIWREINPQSPFEYHILDERIASYYNEERRIAQLVQYFSLICIIIACMGLFGLAAYTAEQKTKEIGIRKVLGASITNIILQLSKEFMVWVLLANIIAIPVGYLILQRWLENFAYHISIPVYIFIVSAIFAALIAVVTVFYQALRAALSNPIDALKYE
jgi:putative ABC transport system permease protein